MKYNQIIITGIASMLMLAGCEIEQVSYGRLDPNSYPSNYKEADEFMLGEVYYGFSSWYIMNSTQGWWIRSNIVSDEFEAKDYVACYAGFDLNPYANLTTGYGGYPVGDEYTDWNLPFFFYSQYIFKALMAMDKFKDIQMPDNEKRLLNTQLHCAMGWLAFMEYDMYGPIPLPGLDVLQHPRDNKSVPRATEKEMQTFIEEHLKAALSESNNAEFGCDNTYVENAATLDAKRVGELGMLPYKWTSSEYGRFNRGLAKAVLFDFYMLMGGMKSRYPNYVTREGRDATWYWGEAVKIGRDLEVNQNYDQFGHSLVDDYNSLFTEAGKQNSEVLFSWVMYGDYGLGISPQCLPLDYQGAGHLTRWNVYKMPWAFYDTFEKEDLIRTKNIIDQYIGSGGKLHTRELEESLPRLDGDPLNLGPLPLKYDHTTISGGQHNVDVPLYRRAGNKLLLAEAIVRNNNNTVTPEAITLVDAVRDRVKLGSIADRATAQGKNIYDTQVFLDLLLDERGHELWFEGHRRGDLIRHDKFIEKSVEKAENADFYGERVSRIRNIENGMNVYEWFPIPNRAILESNNIIKQNPGY